MLWLLLLTSLAVLAYAPAQFLPFISDDYDHIVLARQYGPVSGWSALLGDALYRCRAVSLVHAYWVERLFGADPLAFNISSLAMHILNTLLVAALGLWRRIGWRISLPAAAFFAIAEGHQEAVIWYAASPELQVFTFAVTSFLAWSLWLQNKAESAWLYTVSLLAFVLALLSKESGVAAVGLLALAAVMERQVNRRTLMALAPFGLLSLLYFLAGYAARSSHLHYNDGTFSLSAPFWITLPNSLARMLWIWGAAAIGVLVWLRRSALIPLVGFALLWMSISLMPYSFLTYMARVPSRHTYLASAGLALIAGAGALALRERLRGRNQAVLALLAAAIVLHNTGYLWTRKQRQFLERAEPTEQLAKMARETQGLITVRCFPYSASTAMGTVEVVTGGGADRVRFAKEEEGCGTFEFRGETEESPLLPVGSPMQSGE